MSQLVLLLPIKYFCFSLLHFKERIYLLAQNIFLFILYNLRSIYKFRGSGDQLCAIDTYRLTEFPQSKEFSIGNSHISMESKQYSNIHTGCTY